MSDVKFYTITPENLKRFAVSYFLNQLKMYLYFFFIPDINTDCLRLDCWLEDVTLGSGKT